MQAVLPMFAVAVAFLAVYHGSADAAVTSLTELCQKIIVQATAEVYSDQYATAPTVEAIDGAVLHYMKSVLQIPDHLAKPLVPRIKRRAIAIFCGIGEKDEHGIRLRRAIIKPKSCLKPKGAKRPKASLKKKLDDFPQCKACKDCKPKPKPKPGK